MKKKISFKKAVILILASVGTALLVVIAAKLLGYQGNGDGSDMSWWSMIHSIF